MEGMFLRKKFNGWLFLLFLCGLAFIGMYIFLNIVDLEATGELLTFLIMGILIILVVISSWLLNMGAFIRIDEGSIKAKYHWFGKLNCKIDEVACVMAQVNTLTILLKNGKRHIIMGIENAWPLASAIRQQIFTVETETSDILLRKLEAEQAMRKKKLFWILGCVVLMFVNIFIAVFLTGGKEMYDFSNTDWILFSIIGVVEVLTVILTFYFAGQCGKQLLPIEQFKYRLKGAHIASQPLPPGTSNVFIQTGIIQDELLCAVFLMMKASITVCKSLLETIFLKLYILLKSMQAKMIFLTRHFLLLLTLPTIFNKHSGVGFHSAGAFMLSVRRIPGAWQP